MYQGKKLSLLDKKLVKYINQHREIILDERKKERYKKKNGNEEREKRGGGGGRFELEAGRVM